MGVVGVGATGVLGVVESAGMVQMVLANEVRLSLVALSVALVSRRRSCWLFTKVVQKMWKTNVVF